MEEKEREHKSVEKNTQKIKLDKYMDKYIDKNIYNFNVLNYIYDNN